MTEKNNVDIGGFDINEVAYNQLPVIEETDDDVDTDEVILDRPPIDDDIPLPDRVKISPFKIKSEHSTALFNSDDVFSTEKWAFKDTESFSFGLHKNIDNYGISINMDISPSNYLVEGKDPRIKSKPSTNPDDPEGTIIRDRSILYRDTMDMLWEYMLGYNTEYPESWASAFKNTGQSASWIPTINMLGTSTGMGYIKQDFNNLEWNASLKSLDDSREGRRDYLNYLILGKPVGKLNENGKLIITGMPKDTTASVALFDALTSIGNVTYQDSGDPNAEGLKNMYAMMYAIENPAWMNHLVINEPQKLRDAGIDFDDEWVDWYVDKVAEVGYMNVDKGKWKVQKSKDGTMKLIRRRK